MTSSKVFRSKKYVSAPLLSLLNLKIIYLTLDVSVILRRLESLPLCAAFLSLDKPSVLETLDLWLMCISIGLFFW